jgi:hypothetical protein
MEDGETTYPLICFDNGQVNRSSFNVHYFESNVGEMLANATYAAAGWTNQVFLLERVLL